MAGDAGPERATEHEAALDRIETAVQRIRVSLPFTNEIYVLREHGRWTVGRHRSPESRRRLVGALRARTTPKSADGL